MTIEDFEQLLADVGLDSRQASRSYGVAFGVVLRTPTEIDAQYGVVRSLRIQVDWLVYEPAEFITMTQEQAQRQIQACKRKLERAPKTQQGVVK